MSSHVDREQQNGGIVVERDGCTPLYFVGRPQYVAWERAYLTCTVLNGNSRVCFTQQPPQVPAKGKSAPRIRRP